MSIAQASTTKKLKRGSVQPATLRRDGAEDLWATLDAKLAERDLLHKLAKSDSHGTSKGWLRQIVESIGFGQR